MSRLLPFSAALMVLAANVEGQGKSKAEKPLPKAAVKAPAKPTVKVVTPGPKKEAPSKAKKKVTVVDAVSTTRTVLISNGYQIVEVKPAGATQVIYYRRGSMGRGRGLGPVERIVVVPAGEVVTFQYAPPSLLTLINRALGLY